MRNEAILPLTAYHLYEGEPAMKLVPASSQRHWMDETPEKFARRCLPLLLAASSGWHILNNYTIRATWNGGREKSDLIIEYGPGTGAHMALSHFGSGLLTFSLPWLFRTPPGYNLLVRGPANLPKDGIAPLEGLIETDGEVVSTFTMNWKFTRPCTVTFEKDEPFCLLGPVERGELEKWEVSCVSIDAAPEMRAQYQEWSASRLRFNAALARQEPEACQRKWQKDYFQAAKQTKRQLACVGSEGEGEGDGNNV